MGPPVRVFSGTGNASDVAATRRRSLWSEWPTMLLGVHFPNDISAHCFEVRNWRTDRSVRCRAQTALSAMASVHSPMPDPGGRVCLVQCTKHEVHLRAAGGGILLSICRAVRRELRFDLPGADCRGFRSRDCSSYPARAYKTDGREFLLSPQAVRVNDVDPASE